MKKLILIFLILINSELYLNAEEISEASLSIATVNMDKVNLNYTLVKEAREKIYQSEQNLKKLIITANQEVEELGSEKENKLSDKEIAEKRQRIQDSVDKAYLDLSKQKKQYNDKINRNIELILQKIANIKNYDLIINEVFSIQAENDITDIFLEELENLKD